MYGLQDTLLYQPNEPDDARTNVLTPDRFRMPFESIIIETPDNEKLDGFLIKQNDHANDCPTVIFCHGNAGNIGHRYDRKTFFRRENSLMRSIDRINILSVDRTS